MRSRSARQKIRLGKIDDLVSAATHDWAQHPQTEALDLLQRYSRRPAVYPFPYFSFAGGLVSYGPDSVDVHTRAANYIDRILKGEDLPTFRAGADQISTGDQPQEDGEGS